MDDGVSDSSWAERPVRIVQLEQVTTSRPAQWQGLTEERAEIYIRYRVGTLRVDLGPQDGDWMHLNRDVIWSHDDGTGGGELTTAEMIARLPGWITVEILDDHAG